jgi:membrane-bound ClpP family serine protease
MTPQVFYLVKFCSAYVVAFGVAMILLATNPVKYKSIMWVAITLFSIRIIERLIFTELLNSSFGIPLATELTTSGILVVIIALLLIFQPKNNK